MQTQPTYGTYAETIMELEDEGHTVIQARLADRLDVSRATVSETISRMRDEGLVEGASILSLTETGRELAETVIRRHRLAERLLTDVIGLEWHLTHNEAVHWEKVISTQVEEKLISLLGSPTTCPHGNPIPGSGYIEVPLEPLAAMRPGDEFTVRRVPEEVENDYPTLEYLGVNRFTPGTDAVVAGVAPDGTFTVAYGERALGVGHSLAEKLLVARR